VTIACSLFLDERLWIRARVEPVLLGMIWERAATGVASFFFAVVLHDSPGEWAARCSE
jgi:hypothetical protein